jgi:molecular chaperone GrpE
VEDKRKEDVNTGDRAKEEMPDEGTKAETDQGTEHGQEANAATDKADGDMMQQDGEPTLEQQLEDLREKNEEYYDRLLRLQADFDNYKKRTAREKEEIYSYIAGEILVEFLGVLDNMERASAAAAGDSGEGGASLREGIDMVVKQLKEILAKYDVEEIPTEGVKFDPNFHHAVMQEEDSGKEEGTILEVFQKGYRIKTRVLRPSIVKVAL